MNTRFPAERVRLSQWQKEIGEKLKGGGPIAISSEAAGFLLADLKKAEDRLFQCEVAMESATSDPARIKAVEEGTPIGFASESSTLALSGEGRTRTTKDEDLTRSESSVTAPSDVHAAEDKASS